MTTKSKLTLIAALCAGAVSCGGAKDLSPQDRLTVNDERIDAIIEGMSLEEKVEMLHAKTIMSSEGVPRLGIQELRYTDGPFGIREEVADGFRPKGWTTDSATYFPTGSALAATWSPELAYEYGQGMGVEARRRGKDIILGPAINIQRLPVGGRSYEYFSEDPVLSAALAVGYVRGTQDAGTAACIKHFALNSQETNRGSVNSVVDERTMREIYLKPFEAAVKEGGAMAVMPAYNKVNGTACSENPYLLNDILRGEWGFKGLTVSDWGGTYSTVGAALGGLDVQMPGNNFFGQALLDSVKAGKVPESVIDEKVRHLLRVRLAVEAVPDSVANTERVSQPTQQRTAYEVARKSIVLMKNNGGILPMGPDVKKIAVIGLNAVASTAAGGMGAGVKAPYEVTPLQGIREAVGADVEVSYAQGYKNYMGMFGAWRVRDEAERAKLAQSIDEDPDPSLLREAVELAASSDMVVFFAGTNKSIESEGLDREDISLPVGQNAILREIAAVNRNVVTVVISGGPCDLREVDKYSMAVVQGWWNGMEGGHALADVLFGKMAPSGKLPFTYPMKLEDSPAFALGAFPQVVVTEEDIFRSDYRKDLGGRGGFRKVKVDAEYTEGQLVGYRWFDTKGVDVLYPFGHGLSYVSFSYEDLSTDRDAYGPDGVIKASFRLTNTGDMEADEVAQLYVHRLDATVEWPYKELKAFDRVTLAPGETKAVTLEVPVSELRWWNAEDRDWALEGGKVELLVGASSADLRLSKAVEIQTKR